jgi:hypothetical protein
VVTPFSQFEGCRGSRLGQKDSAVASHDERSRRSCEYPGTTEWQSDVAQSSLCNSLTDAFLGQRVAMER